MEPHDSAPQDVQAFIVALDEVDLSRFRVVGTYTRYDEAVRNALQDARQKILAGFEPPGRRRENHLIWAAPGTGKTFFVQQVAASLGDSVRYHEINLAKCSEAEFQTALGRLDDRQSSLCLIDEADAKPQEPWPYEMLLPYLDAAVERGARFVFVLAGSSGTSLDDIKQRIAVRPKGSDLLSRIPTGHEHVIGPMSLGDRLLIVLSQLWQAGQERVRDIRAIEKLGLYYVALNPRLANARQLREFAIRTVERVPRTDDRVKYDHFFVPGDPENKAFWMQAQSVAERLVHSFVILRGDRVGATTVAGQSASPPDRAATSVSRVMPETRSQMEVSHDAMEQEIRFCQAPDTVRIAYATIGSGPPLLKAANWMTHLEFDLRSPIWQHWWQRLSAGRCLIRYDERGNGLSDWDAEDLTFEAMVRDLETVADALNLDRFPLVGISQGGAIAAAYAVRHPERVSHLIIYGSYVRGRAKRGGAAVEELETQMAMTRLGWGKDDPAYRTVFTMQFMPEATREQQRWFNDLQRASASPENAVRLQRMMGDIDVAEILPSVTTPTLVLHCRGDARVPFEAGREFAALVPGARFVPLDGRNHLPQPDDPCWAPLIAEIRSFLGEPTMAPRSVTPRHRVAKSPKRKPSAGR